MCHTNLGDLADERVVDQLVQSGHVDFGPRLRLNDTTRLVVDLLLDRGNPVFDVLVIIRRKTSNDPPFAVEVLRVDEVHNLGEATEHSVLVDDNAARIFIRIIERRLAETFPQARTSASAA